MIILLSLILGITILISMAVVFYKWSLKIFHLYLLFLGLLIINLFIGNDALHLIISFIIIGASAGFTFRNNKKLQFFIIVSSLSMTLIFTSNHYYLKNFKNIDILENSKDRFIGIIKENNVPESERVEIFQRINETLDLIANIIPFTYFLNSLVLALMCIYFLKYLFKRKFIKDESYIDSIESFKLKEYLVFIFIFAWFVVLLIDKKDYFLYTIALNIALIFSCLYLIQAFGIIKFILRKKKLPFSLLPVIMLSFFLIGVEYFLFIIIILCSIGVLDFWADFRRFNAESKT